jgi:putative DNA primase/helicase
MPERKLWNFNSIAEDLRSIPQWINWKYATRKGKITKPPCTPAGKNMDAQAPKNWLSFSQAVDAFERNQNLAGVGLVLTRDLGLVGIDLDNCIDSEGKIADWALEVVRKVGSYTEISPSGRGLRIFTYGTLPDGSDGRKVGNVEMYVAGRYLTVTGNVLDLGEGES